MARLAASGILAYPQWSYANRLAISLNTSYLIKMGLLEQALAIFDGLTMQFPADVSLWYTLKGIPKQFPDSFPLFRKRLEVQIQRSPFVREYWKLLADIASEADLSSALRLDLQERIH